MIWMPQGKVKEVDKDEESKKMGGLPGWKRSGDGVITLVNTQKGNSLPNKNRNVTFDYDLDE